jgi:putative Mn2+ efflux pump MntP
MYTCIHAPQTALYKSLSPFFGTCTCSILHTFLKILNPIARRFHVNIILFRMGIENIIHRFQSQNHITVAFGRQSTIRKKKIQTTAETQLNLTSV